MKKLIILLFLAAPLAAFAADDGADASGKSSPEGAKPKITYRQHSAVSFDDAVVEGSTNNPEGVYVVTPPERATGSLLKLRPNFHRELMRDALLLK